jgi:segregation and condensation protein A
MEEVTFQLEQFDFKGPLDLLLTLIQKNKINITDLPIALLCDQYLAAIAEMEQMDMELASDFLLMASELMYIKSKMMLPREEKEEKDPRMELTDALLRYQAAKEGALKMTKLYAVHSARMVKDTDEISIDTSYVADQQVTSLCLAVRRIIAANESRPKPEKAIFAPMIAKPIVPVEIKIVGILHRMEKKKNTSMQEILSDATSLPDLIAIFLGILELVKVRKILIEETAYEDAVHGTNTVFTVNDEDPETAEKPKNSLRDSDEPIPLSSKAEMHREQRRIIREQKLAEKKRLRAEERARRAEERRRAAETADGELSQVALDEELPADDRDLEEEARISAMLEDQLSEQDEDLLDDLGLDMQEIVRQMAEKSKEFTANQDDNS